MPSFSNQATLSYNSTTVSSNVVTGEIVGIMSVTKNALQSSYSAGSELTYVINLTNTGASAFTGVTVSDNLGAYTVGTSEVTPLTYVENSAKLFVNGALQADPAAAVTDGSLVFSGLTVPAEGNAQIMYKATANSFAPLAVGSSITNTATVNYTAARSTVEATETVNAGTDPVLSIVKAVSPSTVPENGTLTYTFTITNTGNTAASAADSVVVSDTFDPVLAITSVTLNGTPMAEGTGYTYDAQTGEFATISGAVTVPAASYAQSTDGSYTITPGTAVLVVSGTI